MLVGPVGWYIRLQMTETPMDRAHKPSVKTVLQQHSRTLWLGVLLMAAPTSCIYLLVYYMPVYLVNTLHMAPTISLLSACLSSTLIFISVPLMARVADRQRLRKPIQYVTAISSLLLVYPTFLLLTRGVSEYLSLLVIGVFSTLALCSNAAYTVMMLEAFPRHQRATGVSIIYSFGVTIFGGFCPFIVTWLISVTGSPMAPAWYLLAALGISLFALTRFPNAADVR
jgi:hypothetical protein